MTTIAGPKGGIFGLGNVLDLQRDPLHFLMKTAHDYDDIIHIRFGPFFNFYLLTHPNYVREVLVNHADKMVKWGRQEHATRKAAGNGLVVNEGDSWWRQRKLVAPAFHTQRIKHYLNLMADHTLRLIAHWQDGSVYEMDEQMTTATMGIIGEILFDIQDIEKDAHELSEALKILLEMFMLESMSFFPAPDWVPTPRNLRENQAMKTTDDYLMNIIRERRESGVDKGDVLSSLLHAVDEDDGGHMTDQQARDELMTLFIAGHETTAVLMNWVLYMLAQHPDIQEKLYQEVVQVVQGASPTLEELGMMTYTDKVIKETLRLYPPTWSLFVRSAVDDIPVGEHVIPKGAVVWLCPWVLHHDPRFWHDPQTFDPDRFEGDYKSRLTPYSYFPFGGGPRVCVGSHLAEMEAEIILSTLVKHFKFEMAQPGQIVNPEARFTIHPDGGMHLRVVKR